MSSNNLTQVSYLRSSREFPEDIHLLSVQISKSYIDIANAVNLRTIGVFPKNTFVLTGESWFLTSSRQQSLRQIYTFSTINPGVPISIPYRTDGLTQFSRIYGTCITAVPDYRPIPFASVTANANIEIKVVPTSNTTGNIVITSGAASPVINSGLAIIEWLSNV